MLYMMVTSCIISLGIKNWRLFAVVSSASAYFFQVYKVYKVQHILHMIQLLSKRNYHVASILWLFKIIRCHMQISFINKLCYLIWSFGAFSRRSLKTVKTPIPPFINNLLLTSTWRIVSGWQTLDQKMVNDNDKIFIKFIWIVVIGRRCGGKVARICCTQTQRCMALLILSGLHRTVKCWMRHDRSLSCRPFEACDGMQG